MLKQVSVSVKGTNPFKDLASKYACKINVVDCRDFNSHGMGLLVEISGDRSEELIRELKSTQNVRRVYFSKNGSKKALTMVILDSPLYCNVAHQTGAFCMSCPYMIGEPLSDGSEEDTVWKLLVKDSTSLRRTLDMLESSGAKTELKGVSNAFRDDMLTTRQREILLTAIRLGHFEFPRKIDLTELAEKLSIKPSTLSEILRRAEAKIAQYYLESIRGSSS